MPLPNPTGVKLDRLLINTGENVYSQIVILIILYFPFTW